MDNFRACQGDLPWCAHCISPKTERALKKKARQSSKREIAKELRELDQ